MADWFTRGAFTVRSRKTPDITKETHALYRQAAHLFAVSEASQQDSEEVALQAALKLAADHDLELPRPVLVSFAIAIDHLMFEAGLYLPDYDIETIDPLGTDGKYLRDRLRSQISFLEHETTSLGLMVLAFEAIFSHILGRMALNLACVTALNAAKPDDQGLSLRLVDFIDDVPATIEAIISCLFSKEFAQTPMFQIMRDDIEREVNLASGLDPSRRYEIQKITMPTDARWDDPAELVSRYLGPSPFPELLNTELPVTFPDEARFEHTHILGGTGHGKTQLMSQLILRDIARAQDEKRSIIVMDSQGDLIAKILALADIHGSHLSDKLVVIDPTEFERPIALNPFTLDEARLADYSPADRERLIHSAVSLFEYFFGELLGAELTAQQGTVFKYLIRLLVEIPGATLITLRDLMDTPETFRPHIEKLTGSAHLFFEREFLSGSYGATRKQISRRLWAVLVNPVFERLFSSPVNKLDWFSLMQDGHIILINTAKDFLKPEGSRLFGRFLTAQIGQGILERAAIPEHQRTPTMFYIDEAQDQIDDTITMLLSQGRKYKLGLTLTHQHLDQLTPPQRSDLMANTSIKLAGGINRKDASILAGEMHCSPDFLQGMRKRGGQTQFAFAMRHMIDKAVPLTVPLGLIDDQARVAPEVIAQSLELNRQRYGRVWEPEVFESKTPASEASVAPAQSKIESVASQVKQPNVPATLPGRGSAAHKAEQERIRVLGSELGYLAEVEKTLDRGLGAVDVCLSNDKARIAVEISITTPPEHEVGNIMKCLSAGFDYVITTAPTRKRLRAIEHCAWREIPASDSPKTLFLLPEDIEGFLRGHQEEPDENKIMGYTVIVKKVPKSSEEKRRRRERLEWLLEQSRS